MTINEEGQRCVGALHEIGLIADYHASSRDGAVRIAEICKMLAARDRGMGQYGGLCRTVADAISKAYLQKPF